MGRDMGREKMLERRDRQIRAENKRKDTMEKLEKKQIQSRITSQLKLIPENRRKILEMEIERERIMILKEAKEELWKKWSQKKGRNQYRKQPKGEEEKADLERKLERIEEAAKEYE